MMILKLTPQSGARVRVETTDQRVGLFDVTPWLELEAFKALNDHAEFIKMRNGGYFIEWDCGADLSADTLEAHTVWESA